eukprot:444678_1
MATEEKDEKKLNPKALFGDISSFNATSKLKKAKKQKKIITKPRDQLYKIDNKKKNNSKRLLIIDFQTNWYEQFKDAALKDGTPIIIEQTQWPLIDIEASSNKNEKIIVELKPNQHIQNPNRKHNTDEIIQFKPDFLLIRSLPTNIHGYNFKNILMGFMFANIPSINSLHSIFMTMERCLVYSALNKLNNLPLIEMSYHPNFSARTDYLLHENKIKCPKVIKVGSCHSGFGKSRAQTKDEMDDIRSILILNKDYYTEETFIDIKYEYRIQKIGDIIRVFKRIQSDNWKTHISSFVEMKLTKQYIEWINNASSIFNGLDICALDVVKDKNNNDIILELNDTAIGLMGSYEVEDESNIRDLVVNRMCSLFS